MQVRATGQIEHYDGNQVGQYGRVLGSSQRVFVQYPCGLRSFEGLAWGLQADVEWNISVSVDQILMATTDGLYAVARDSLRERTHTLGGVENYVARPADDFVTYVGDPNDHLGHNLW